MTGPTLYAVFEGVDYEGEGLKAVYATEEEAKAHRQEPESGPDSWWLARLEPGSITTLWRADGEGWLGEDEEPRPIGWVAEADCHHECDVCGAKWVSVKRGECFRCAWKRDRERRATARHTVTWVTGENGEPYKVEGR